jgi:enoyl-CoA hydratase/carnithine racemase
MGPCAVSLLSRLLSSPPQWADRGSDVEQPGKRNGLSDELLAEWAARRDELANDDAVHAVVVTVAGEGFCSGGDIPAMVDAVPSVEAFEPGMETVHLVAQSVARFENPLVGAVNGPAYGAGTDMALMCDLRVASERASCNSRAWSAWPPTTSSST